MKIVLATISLDPQNGAGTAERTRQLAIHLRRLGWECVIVALEGTAWLGELNDAGIEVYLTGYRGRRFPIPLPRPIKLWRIIQSADVIHVMGYWYVLAPLICVMARLNRTPFVLCPAGELTPLYRYTFLKRIFQCVFRRWMIGSAELIIATTARERDELIRIDEIARHRVTISPNGVARSKNAQSCNPDLYPTPFILFIGRLAPIKGPDLLIEAFATICHSLPQLSLIIAGPDRGMRGMLEARVRSLGLGSRVLFLGFVDERTREALHRSAAFLVIPSRSEVMSIVALEAAVTGTPVLLTDRCGFDEIEEIGGGLVVSADVDGLTHGLTAMLKESANLAEMGERLRRFVLAHYEWHTVATQLQETLAELVKKRSQA